ncbi:MAG TPA: hypothetical protein VJZ48_01285 [Bacilli bacterium]|nr:hypothetical protein [Bacilli bacterium]
MKKRRIKTSISKGPLIFSLTGFLLSVAIILAFLFTDQPPTLAAVVIVVCSIFIILALIIIFDQIFDYVEIKDGKLHAHILFIHKQINLKKIENITLKNDVYYFYRKDGRKFTSINAFDPLASEIVREVEKGGAKISQ